MVRLVWVMAYNALMPATGCVVAAERPRPRCMPTAQGAFVVGWCGMRGIVTLATALALPFEMATARRSRIATCSIAAAFAVVLGTLVLQGLTLGPLLRWLDLADDGVVEREEVFARQEIARAALQRSTARRRPEAKILRKGIQCRAAGRRALEDYAEAAGVRPAAAATPSRRNATRSTACAASRKIGDDAFQTVQEELDWAEGHAAHRKRAFSARRPIPPDEPPTDGRPEP